jgi:hypothetical protein
MSEPVVVVDRDGRSRTLRDDDLIADGERMRVTLPMMDAAQKAVAEGTRAWDRREQFYRDAVTDDTWAWKRAGVPDAYPLSAGENSICTVNGRPGHLVPARDGSPWLECVADEVGAAPAKTDAVSRRADALPLKDAMQRLNDAREAAYREIEDRDATAWQRPIASGISK